MSTASRFGRLTGGVIELEKMGSANSPLSVAFAFAVFVNIAPCCGRNKPPSRPPGAGPACLAPHHRLHLFAQHYDEVARRHPRFVRWRRDFDHVVQAWCVTEPDAAVHPGLCIAGDRSLELLDRDHWRAKRSDEPGDARRGRERLDAILQRSTPGFSGTTLGL